MRPGYEVEPAGAWRPGMVWRDAQVAVVAAAVAVGCWTGSLGGRRAVVSTLAVAAAAAAALAVERAVAGSVGGAPARRSLVPWLLLGLLVGAAGWRSSTAWAAASPRTVGPFLGWATVVDDPVRDGPRVRVVLELDGERFRVDAYGAPARRAEQLPAGSRAYVSAERRPASGAYARRLQVRHVVGTAELDWIADAAPASAAMRVANRVRAALRASAEQVMAPDDAALFAGLVIGDDAREPDELVERFRRAGLSHLTAVSGQNVAYVLALAGVLLRRLRTWPRLVATVGVVGWFVLLTRGEPSVLRAGVMAVLAALAFAAGEERSPFRLLCLAVVVLVLVDPLLVWSVGFWLSTGATAGVTVAAPWLEARLRGPRWLVAPLAVSAGAQLGVAVPSLLVFGRLPAVGVLANLVAVPVAGAVMLVGIPAALVAAAAPHGVAVLVMAPASLGTRWVAAVAAVADRLEPAGSAAAVAWAVQVATLGVAVWPGRRPAAAGSPATPAG